MHEQDAFADWLKGATPELLQAIVSQLVVRRGSAFQICGQVAVAQTVDGLLEALHVDLRQGGSDRMRADLMACLRPLSERPLGFRDLRSLLLALRGTLLSALDRTPQLPVNAVRRLDDWCLEMTLQFGLVLLNYREEVIARQASEIEARLAEQRHLSIPIAPVYEGVLVIPLVGVMDSYRAEVLTERVLQELQRTRAQLLLLDISGVTAIDKEVVSYLWKVTQASRLLGAEMLWVGISVETAKLMANLGVDFSEIVTLRSLQEGLAYALSRLDPEVADAMRRSSRRSSERSSPTSKISQPTSTKPQRS